MTTEKKPCDCCGCTSRIGAFRKKPCDCCGCTVISIEKGLSKYGNKVKEVYDERCSLCGNLLYGYSKLI